MPYRAIGHLDAEISQRFLGKIEKASSGCWEWRGARAHGYGVFSIRVSSSQVIAYKAHRYAYALLAGEVPVDRQLDHLCDNKGCVNPAHLKIVTARENVLRSDHRAKQLARRTHCNHGHEFTPENTYLYGTTRQCRICNAERAKIGYLRRRAALTK